MGCQYAVESYMSLMPAGDGHKGVMLGQASLLLPGSLIIASQWLSGEGRVSEHGAAACPDLDTFPVPPSRLFVPLSHTFLRQSTLRAGRGIALFQGNVRMSGLE